MYFMPWYLKRHENITTQKRPKDLSLVAQDNKH
jgi:hypothetical protein